MFDWDSDRLFHAANVSRMCLQRIFNCVGFVMVRMSHIIELKYLVQVWCKPLTRVYPRIARCAAQANSFHDTV